VEVTDFLRVFRVDYSAGNKLSVEQKWTGPALHETEEQGADILIDGRIVSHVLYSSALVVVRAWDTESAARIDLHVPFEPGVSTLVRQQERKQAAHSGIHSQ
jgi:hypothetical protein